MTKSRPLRSDNPRPTASGTRHQPTGNAASGATSQPQVEFDFGDRATAPGARRRGSGAGLVPLPGSAGAPLTPEQKRFRKLSGQVEEAREALERFKQQAREYGQRQAELTRPLVADLVRCGEVLLRAMEAFDGAQKLSPAQHRTLRRCITELAAALIERMDGPPPDWMVDIHDRHASKTHAQQVKEEKLSMQAMLGETLGEDLGDELLSDEELAARLAQAMAADARRKEDAEASEEAEGADATGATGARQRQRPCASDRAADRPTGPGAARTARGRGTASAAAERKATEALQFTQSVREVYRKLASALHPDRVPEGPEREAMTALMQQANQAYEGKDLLKLLDLQARLDSHASGDARQRVMGLSAATLRHYNQLLDQELGDLRSALLIEQDHLLVSHPGLAPYLLGRTTGKTRAEMLARAGQDELQAFRLQIEEAQDGLKALSNAASGRRWITQQRQRHREEDENAALDEFFSSLMGNGPPGFGPDAFDDADDIDPFKPPRRGRRGSTPEDDSSF
jgi:curved DNA-binding protein CbpA